MGWLTKAFELNSKIATLLLRVDTLTKEAEKLDERTYDHANDIEHLKGQLDMLPAELLVDKIHEQSAQIARLEETVERLESAILSFEGILESDLALALALAQEGANFDPEQEQDTRPALEAKTTRSEHSELQRGFMEFMAKFGRKKTLPEDS